MQEKIVITEQNIEEMCRLAEDVMQVLYMEYFFYDEEGNERLLSELEKENEKQFTMIHMHTFYIIYFVVETKLRM